MEQLVKNDENNFSIIFGGKNEIDVNTLIDSLNGTVELMNYVATSKSPNATLKINVTGTSKGSFRIDFSSFAGILPILLSSQSITMAKDIIESFTGLLELKKHLKGSPAKEKIDKDHYVEVINKDNESVVVNNYTINLYNQDSDKIISKIFNHNIYDRQSLSVVHNGEEKVKIEKKDFENMTKEIVNDTSENELSPIINQSKVNFAIKKADLIGSSKWDLVRVNSNKAIKVSIEDSEFLFKVRSGEISINAKTTLECTLKTTTYFNEVHEIDKQVHAIIKVHDIVTEVFEQLKFDY